MSKVYGYSSWFTRYVLKVIEIRMDIDKNQPI